MQFKETREQWAVGVCRDNGGIVAQGLAIDRDHGTFAYFVDLRYLTARDVSHASRQAMSEESIAKLYRMRLCRAGLITTARNLSKSHGF
jgi:hypothetical protein